MSVAVRAQAKAPNTQRAYRSDWRQFQQWCAEQGIPSVPSDPLSLDRGIPLDLLERYVVDRVQEGELKPHTMRRHVAAFNHFHRLAGLPTSDEKVEETLKGLVHGENSPRFAVAPLMLTDLERMVESLSDSPIDVRSRAVLTVGWWGALRRGQLSGMRVTDVIDDQGARIKLLVRRSGNQKSHSRSIMLDPNTWIKYGMTPTTNPVEALRTWIRRGDRRNGFVFCGVSRWGHPSGKRLNPQVISDTIKSLDSRFTGDSLRAGFATEMVLRQMHMGKLVYHMGVADEARVHEWVQMPDDMWERSLG